MPSDFVLVVLRPREADAPGQLVDGEFRDKGHLPLDLAIVELFPFPA